MKPNARFFILPALLFTGAVGHFAHADAPDDGGGDPVLDAQLVGTWCFSSWELVSDFMETKPSMAEIEKQRRAVRRFEATRIELSASGDATVRIAGEVVQRGEAASIAGTLHGIHVFFEWSQTASMEPFDEPYWLVQESKYGLYMEEETKTYWFGKDGSNTCWQTQPEPTESGSGEAPLSWAEKPTRAWPQIVLTNAAGFRGSTRLTGASGFLVEHNGVVHGATARHLLGSSGGVEPAVELGQLSQSLLDWTMYPRTKPRARVRLGATSNSPRALPKDSDWLLLDLIGNKPKAIQPLTVRQSPARVGETVYLIGCPYSEPSCKQNVYKGVVTGRTLGYFRYDFEKPVELRGFSGAPIVDANGRLLGVMTIKYSIYSLHGSQLEGGAEDANYLLRWLVG